MGEWWRSTDWDDTADTDADTPTHRCRACDHGARIQTPQRRTEHFCRDCGQFRRFVMDRDA